MPAERGKDAAERFAAAVDRGRSPRVAGSDADLARELEIAACLRSQDGTQASHSDAMAMLRSGGPTAAAFDPRPDEKARAKQRLMALLAEANPVASGSERREATTTGAAIVEFPTPADRTAPIPVVSEPELFTNPDNAAAEAVMADEQPATSTDGSVVASGSERREATTDGRALAPVTPLASRRIGRHSRGSRPAGRPHGDRRHGLARRAGLVSSAALLVLVAFTGAGVFASRDALPGQTLYPLKRAAEAAGLAMTFDDEARAQRNLELAAVRLGEVEQLIALRGSDVDPELFTAAMSEFDVATNEGSQALLSGQGANGGGPLQEWAATQSARLSALRSALPVPAVPAADTSIALLDKLLAREGSLDTSTPADDATAGEQVDEDGATVQRNSQNAEDADPTDPAGESADPGLPSLGPDNGPLAGDPSTDEPAPSRSPGQVEEKDRAQLPLPLPGAPVTLPPLLPGMPPLSIG